MAPLRTARIRPRCSTTKKTLRSVGSWTNATGCVKPVAKVCARSWASASVAFAISIKIANAASGRRIRKTLSSSAMPRSVSRVVVVAWLCLLTACGSGNSPEPSPPGAGVGETITGRERIGWDQQASSPAELATFRYAIYVDGARSEIAEVSCSGERGSGRLPLLRPASPDVEWQSRAGACVVHRFRRHRRERSIGGIPRHCGRTRSGHRRQRSPLAMS